MKLTDNLKRFYAQTDLLISKFRQADGNVLIMHGNSVQLTIYSRTKNDKDGLPVTVLTAYIEYISYVDNIDYGFLTVNDEAVPYEQQKVKPYWWWDAVDRELSKYIKEGEADA